MRILYLPAYFYSETAASSYLGENRNQAFADAGFAIIAYVPTPCRGINKVERDILSGSPIVGRGVAPCLTIV